MQTSDFSAVVERGTSAGRSLRRVKIVHTLVWALFAVCIATIPVMASVGRDRAAVALILVVLVEVLILMANGGNCPLTAVAAQYTWDRRANFDIYLPEWLARHNKTVFGLLYFAGIAMTFWGWAG
jgi:hypothetical protein